MRCCVAVSLIETDRERRRQNGPGLAPPPSKTPSPHAGPMPPMDGLLALESWRGLMGEDRCSHCTWDKPGGSGNITPRPINIIVGCKKEGY